MYIYVYSYMINFFIGIKYNKSAANYFSRYRMHNSNTFRKKIFFFIIKDIILTFFKQFHRLKNLFFVFFVMNILFTRANK